MQRVQNRGYYYVMDFEKLSFGFIAYQRILTLGVYGLSRQFRAHPFASTDAQRPARTLVTWHVCYTDLLEELITSAPFCRTGFTHGD